MALYTGLDRLARLVAASRRFQVLVGELSEIGALNHVVVPVASDELANDPVHAGTLRHTWPRAIVGPAPGTTYEQTDLYGHRCSPRATLVLEAEAPASVTAGLDPADEIKAEWAWFANEAEIIIREMLALRGRGESVPGETHLNVTSITLPDEGPMFEPKEERAHPSAGFLPNLWWVNMDVAWSN